MIGAGVSACTFAKYCYEGGMTVHLFEMGRGCGGRASSRRHPTKDISIDHGAPIFHAETEIFTNAMNDLYKRG